MDPDPVRAEKARQRIAEKAIKNVTVSNEHVERWSSAPQSVDAAICSHVVQHIPEGNMTALLEGIARILCPGGLFILLTCVSRSPNDEFRIAEIVNGSDLAWRSITASEYDESLRNADTKGLPVRIFSIENLKLSLAARFNVEQIKLYNVFSGKTWLDDYIFRDDLVNLPILRAVGWAHADVMLVMRKRDVRDRPKPRKSADDSAPAIAKKP